MYLHSPLWQNFAAFVCLHWEQNELSRLKKMNWFLQVHSIYVICIKRTWLFILVILFVESLSIEYHYYLNIRKEKKISKQNFPLFQDAVNSIIRRHKIKPHWMFALDSLVRNAVQQSVNVLHPENPTAPLDSAIHLEPYPFDVCINRSSRRKRGMASNPLFIIPVFFCIFQMNLAMTTLHCC